MKISFDLSATTARKLADVLKSVNVPARALAEIAREHVSDLCDREGALFIAEGYVYSSRGDASTVASTLFGWFPGTDTMILRYRRRGRVVAENFKNPAPKRPAALTQ